MAIHKFEPLPPHLAKIQVEMEQHASDYGLDFFPTIFEVVDYDQLNAVAAYGGFPTRYPHWRFGMEYEQLSKGYSYGLQKIYELVINNDPCYAYLMKSNGLTDQKMVMAHVYGHCDFFKNNHWFSATNRKMMDQMANHGQRVRRHGPLWRGRGRSVYRCLPQHRGLIDIHSPFIKRHDPRTSTTSRVPTGRPRPGRFPRNIWIRSSTRQRPCRPSPNGCDAADQHRVQYPLLRPAMFYCFANTHRSSRGSSTCFRCCATRPITLPRRPRPRS